MMGGWPFPCQSKHAQTAFMQYHSMPRKQRERTTTLQGIVCELTFRNEACQHTRSAQPPNIGTPSPERFTRLAETRVTSLAV